MKQWRKTPGCWMAVLSMALAACGGPEEVPREEVPTQQRRGGFGFRMGAGGNDYGKDVTVDAVGNVYTTGYIASTVDFEPGPGTVELTGSAPADIYLAKYDAAGALLWARRMGAAGADMPHSVIIDPRGDVLLFGYFSGAVDFDPGAGTANVVSRGARDIFVAKYDPSGGFLGAFGFGGTGDDEGMDLEVDAAGNLYVTALLTGTADVDPGTGVVEHTVAGPGDVFVAKYGADFSHQWSFRVGGAEEDQGAGIDVDGQGNVYVSGSFRGTVDFDPGAGERLLTSAGVNDLFVAKYSPSGEHLWSHRMGGPGNDVMAPGGIDLDASGRVLTTGRFSGTVDFDPGVGTSPLQSAGLEDVFVARFRPDGAHDLAFRLGGLALDGGHRVVVDAAGDILVGGWFRDTTDFDPGAGTALVTAAGTGGASDLFVAKYRADGGFVWTRTLGGQVTGGESGSIVAGLATDSERNVLMTGRLFGSADVDPGDARQELASAGGSDVVLVKFTPEGQLWRAPLTFSGGTP